MGSTLPATSPPQRIAEEYAMLDCISGGRLVAGMPLGSSADINFCYGIPPLEQRERWREAHDLIISAWTRKDVFPWNGKYFQLRYVNTWPKPIQQPHPPVWVPGSGSASTWDFTAEHDHCYCFLSYFGNNLGKVVMDGFWEYIQAKGKDMNPYRAGFLQLVVVSETDAKAEEEYFDHIKYFYDKCLHVAPQYMAAPGHVDYKSLVRTMKTQTSLQQMLATERKNWKFKDYVDNQFVIAGSPASVVDQLKDAVRKLRVGNLMVLLHIGSMPHELTKKNIALFAKEVKPHIQHIWDDEGWENYWWPERLRQPVTAAKSG
jgi:alkanesulfonate monooxygenase SsuD/methylene tetrahydromethanopterin reductase-like flavin-dependent oxidoreductase (luciferase family)